MYTAQVVVKLVFKFFAHTLMVNTSLDQVPLASLAVYLFIVLAGTRPKSKKSFLSGKANAQARKNYNLMMIKKEAPLAKG